MKNFPAYLKVGENFLAVQEISQTWFRTDENIKIAVVLVGLEEAEFIEVDIDKVWFHREAITGFKVTR